MGAEMSKKDRLIELNEILNRASKAYYDDGIEIMSNFEYDELYDELVELEAETGIVMGNSPTRNVGYTVQSQLPKEAHPRRMLSLDKTKDRDALKSWLGEREGMLSWKLDGLTIVLTYEDGNLIKAVTRGNGAVGEVVTENAKVFVNIPVNISFTGRLVVRGEAVIKYKDFERINQTIDEAESKYKNPRNLCSGSVRQLNSRITAERSVNFYAFTLAEAEGVDFDGSRENQMKWMSAQGFDVVSYKKVDAESLDEAIDGYESEIPEFDIPSDGLVLTFEDLEYASTLGETAKFPRDAIAFKWKDQQAETILREIEWSPSRTGLLNPIAVFDPVELEGTTVSRASVHNLNILEELKLGIGDTISVYKANMIIPQISRNLTGSGKLEIPELCPVCGGDTAVKTDKETKTLTCTNPRCLAKQVKKFSLFVSRDAMNIEGLSEQTILKLIGKGIIKSFPDIFDLSNHRLEIVELEGFGDKSFEKLIKSIEKARKTTPARLLCALGIPGIGVATAAQIASHCKNKWAAIEGLTEDELLEIEGIGDVMSRDYTEFFADGDNMKTVRRLTEVLEIDESFQEKGSGLAGKIFVITGSLNRYRSRKELSNAIESEGGKITGSVTGTTDYLITNDTTSGSEKNRKARDLGVPIITEDEIIEMIEKVR